MPTILSQQILSSKLLLMVISKKKIFGERFIFIIDTTFLFIRVYCLIQNLL